ncbi:SDR family NAD(P)-dependent oxidoreductase [Limosilactobacillus sp.]|jgi:NAD(P)-dependent dehydrogenase (short-subunit alcohol dehydrogenase family)|uniref:SDR family NAD(P)-dependent oxidoreductase n=1 Tax=Limosilactobacillus sp. TaxID=2773925 RepID=UPI0035A173F9
MDEFDRIMRTNVRSAYVFTKYVVPTMIKQHDGQVIMTSSITGTIGQAGGVSLYM